MAENELQIQTGLKTLDFVAIAAYMLITFGIALWFGRRQHSVSDFFVGGRSVPWFAVGLSILATLFSTLTYLGAPGEVIKHGIGYFCSYLAIPLSALVVLKLWIPFFMRLRLTSAYEYLEFRFSRLVRVMGASLFLLLRLGWMSMVVFAASMALDRVKGPDLEFLPGPDMYWWILAVGVIAAIYTSIGGIQAMIWTDVLQCLLLLAGTLMVIGAVMINGGETPVQWWNTAAATHSEHTTPPLFSWDLTVRVTIVTAMINRFFWDICTHGSDQVVLQRYFSTPSLSAARRSYLINIAAEITMITLLVLCGFALLAFYLANPGRMPAGWTLANSADKLFPHFLSSELPAGCAGLVISAFLCDAIQTLEAGVNSVTAVVTTDLTRKSNEEGGRKSLKFARYLSIAIALGVALNAVFVANIASSRGLTIIDLMPRFFNLFVGPLAALFIVGMFLPRCTTRSVLVGVTLGLLTAVLWSWGKDIFGLSTGPTILLAIAVPCVTTIVSSAIISLLIEDGRPHPGRRFTWKAIVKGQPGPLTNEFVTSPTTVEAAASAQP
ncbi:sodium:solute symporter family transporter [Planctomicrobium sp. SH664]|uniref:sodium:solute symporter family transporter n=1 Tax=Planctomicrobium sp. SH664 TaxID=3448125 RepID=UPI003F5BF510